MLKRDRRPFVPSELEAYPTLPVLGAEITTRTHPVPMPVKRIVIYAERRAMGAGLQAAEDQIARLRPPWSVTIPQVILARADEIIQ